MQVLCDDRGFVVSFAFIGELTEGIEVQAPEDIDLFMHQFYAFQLQDGQLVHIASEYETYTTEERKSELRKQRNTECFSVVNRGQLWYATLSVKQIAELTVWYTAWLKVTETMVVPEKPAWLE